MDIDKKSYESLTFLIGIGAKTGQGFLSYLCVVKAPWLKN